MIIFGLDNKVYEKKKLFILDNSYIKNLSIFLAPPKKSMAAVWKFSQRKIIWNTKFKKI